MIYATVNGAISEVPLSKTLNPAALCKLIRVRAAARSLELKYLACSQKNELIIESQKKCFWFGLTLKQAQKCPNNFLFKKLYQGRYPNSGVREKKGTLARVLAPKRTL